MRKFIAIIPVLFSVGCSISTTKSMSDYEGSDSSRIRVKNYLPPLTLEVHEKSNGCYKVIDARTLTAGVNFIGIKSTYNKRIPGMAPPSTAMQGMDSLEYVIKANQHIKITYQEETFRSQYTQIIATRSASFIPEVGHDYDIYPTNGGMAIKDITAANSQVRWWGWDEVECKYHLGWFGRKAYNS
ncbi:MULTISPECIES: hypothetical protein [Dickeya]|uniref:Lipoprotein n=2 Tax=Dickeya TaxID=204037 RepID=D2BYZ4_DICZ5|nr:MULTISPECIES: hypothetical protein [Dickeya]ACZ78801.1 conserved hypothetical protein [Dickeya parazeae Ech586]UCZ73541.1 hypothetical protein LHK94_10675 [Dickeya zeae]